MSTASRATASAGSRMAAAATAGAVAAGVATYSYFQSKQSSLCDYCQQQQQYAKIRQKKLGTQSPILADSKPIAGVKGTFSERTFIAVKVQCQIFKHTRERETLTCRIWRKIISPMAFSAVSLPRSLPASRNAATSSSVWRLWFPLRNSPNSTTLTWRAVPSSTALLTTWPTARQIYFLVGVLKCACILIFFKRRLPSLPWFGKARTSSVRVVPWLAPPTLLSLLLVPSVANTARSLVSYPMQQQLWVNIRTKNNYPVKAATLSTALTLTNPPRRKSASGSARLVNSLTGLPPTGNGSLLTTKLEIIICIVLDYKNIEAISSFPCFLKLFFMRLSNCLDINQEDRLRNIVIDKNGTRRNRGSHHHFSHCILHSSASYA